MTRPLVLALLFVSGGTGLVYELVWSKRLANVLGNSGQAHALVLAVFMGGLALGAWLFGRAADRTSRPVVLYGVLELFVGLYALIFDPVLGALSHAYLSVAGVPGAKLALAGLALVPPTLAMGGTVPVLTRYFTRQLDDARSQLATLYALNSLGAAAGVLAAGLWLVPTFGLGFSERCAAVANLLLATLAILGGRRAVAPTSRSAEPETAYPADVRIALICVALTGFTSMLFEITWVRVLAVVIGGTTYAFTLILAAFILGIALGSFWLSTRDSKLDELTLFSRLQLGVVASICLALPLYARLPYHFLDLWASMPRTAATWPQFQLKTFFVCCAVVVVPAFFIGASFPAVARVALRDTGRLGRQLGGVYLWNTLGTVSGSLLGGLWLLSAIGLEGNFTLGLGATLLAAGLAGRKQWKPVAVAAIAVVAFTAATTGWATDVVSSGRYREWGRRYPTYAEFRAAVKANSKVLFHADDVFASVLVGETPTGMRFLRINGKIDASTGGDVDTQVLAAHLGVLLNGRPVKRVLLVGMGSGVTAGSLLTHPIEHLDVVEISPQVIAASGLFAAETHHANDDTRMQVHLDDAKTFLALQHEPYDLIISEPSNPWVSGVSGLFSRDFFHVARQHLAPGGHLVQWIHTYESSRPLVQLVVRTLRDSFPHATTWLGPADLLLVAGAEPLQLDFDAIAAALQRPTVLADLKRVHVDSLPVLLSRQVHSNESQQRFAGDGPVNTDDHNRLEFESPIAYFIGGYVQFDDDRLDEGRRAQLELARYPVTCDDSMTIAEALAQVHDAQDPVLARAQADAERCRVHPTDGQ